MNRNITIRIVPVIGALLLTGCASLGPKRSPAENCVVEFTKAAARTDTRTALSHVLPTSMDYESISAALKANSLAPASAQRGLWSSIDPDAPVAVTEVRTGERERQIVVWEASIGKDFEIEGESFKAGDGIVFSATLRSIDGLWMIESFNGIRKKIDQQ